MASASTKAATTKSILKPLTTLKGHGDWIESISYFPDGQRMISGSDDKTARQWDVKAGKEIEKARDVCEKAVQAVAISRDGRWVATGGDGRQLKVCEVETGIVKSFKGHSRTITCVDISADSEMLASGSTDSDFTVRVWSLETGKLRVLFKSVDWVGAVRFSTDSKKLAVKSWVGKCLEVWDVQSQKLDVRIRTSPGTPITYAPVFWTNDNKNIIAAFSFTEDAPAKTIYEFDASTLETVGTPFQGHTDLVTGLALSFRGALLASASKDNTIKLWDYESRQLLASFDVQNPRLLVLSPNSRQLAYTVDTMIDNDKIYICDTPPEVLAQARTSARKKAALQDLLNSDATRPAAGRRRPPISVTPMAPRPVLTVEPQQPMFLRLGKFLRFAPSASTVRPVQNDQSNPLDAPATLPIPSSVSGQAVTQFDHFEISSPPPRSNGVVQSLREHLSFLVPRHSHGQPVVEVAPGRKVTRLVAVKLPEYKKVNDTRYPSSQQATAPQENDTSDIDSLPDVHWCKAFLCYYSCWSHGRLRMPPRWRLERVDIPRQDGAANSNSGGSHSRS